MRYVSVCSGIEAATVAWHPLGWTPVAFSEIEKFPSAVLAHHYPNTPNLGDMTQHEQWPIGPGSTDLLVGGTPCQSFSVAGLRRGLADPRGNLALTYLAIADRLRPRWLLWENVPGVLSSSNGRDFGSFLGALAELGYGFAYRVLDAQYHGVAQRRRRVFLVGHASDWRRAAAVLFERESMRGDPAPSREAREAVASDAQAGARAGSWWDGSDCASTLTKEGAGGNQRMPDKDNFGAVLTPLARDNAVHAAVAMVNMQGSKSNAVAQADGPSYTLNAMHGHDVHAVAFSCKDHGSDAGEVCPTLRSMANSDSHANGGGQVAVAVFQQSSMAGKGTIGYETSGIAKPVKTQVDGQMLHHGMAVRRLTPIECERLQGFPDHYTAIPWRGKPATECPDGPRYRALGNSMAVPCMRWIGQRIAQVDAIAV